MSENSDQIWQSGEEPGDTMPTIALLVNELFRRRIPDIVNIEEMLDASGNPVFVVRHHSDRIDRRAPTDLQGTTILYRPVGEAIKGLYPAKLQNDQ